MNNKHAYLILAHNNFELLKKLIILLDDERNDIYIHIDLKNSNFNRKDFDNIVKYSNLIFISRSSILWADYSMIKVELDLLNSACSNSNYRYYHLISGMDLPIKTQDEIHEFFEDKDSEFIGICPNEVWYSVRRLKFYHPLVSCKKYRCSKFLKGLDRIFEYFQRVFRVNRLKNKNIKVIDGWQWFSITDNFARYILSQKTFIEETFRSSIASDELVFQTMIYNSDFYSKIYNDKSLMKGSLRYIDWNRGRPYTFRKEDFNELVSGNNEMLFARKFDPKVDSEIINKIFDYINNKQNKGL